MLGKNWKENEELIGNNWSRWSVGCKNSKNEK